MSRSIGKSLNERADQRILAGKKKKKEVEKDAESWSTRKQTSKDSEFCRYRLTIKIVWKKYSVCSECCMIKSVIIDDDKIRDEDQMKHSCYGVTKKAIANDVGERNKNIVWGDCCRK